MALNMSVGRILICPLGVSYYVRWTPDLSVGLLLCSFFFLGDPEKKFLLFYHYPSFRGVASSDVDVNLTVVCAVM